MSRIAILDTDIGTNPDDFFALLMLLNTKELDLKLVITGNNHVEERAQLADLVLKNAEKSIVRVVAGEHTGHIAFFGEEYIKSHLVALSGDYREEIKNLIDQYKFVTYINIEGCSNLAGFLKKYPEYVNKMNVYHMGLSTHEHPHVYVAGGTNMEADHLAAKYVYERGLHMKVVGSQTTVNDALRMHPDSEVYKKIEHSQNPNHKILLRHLHDFYSRREIWPALHDPLLVSVALGKDFVKFHEKAFEFDERGYYREGGTKRYHISEPTCDAVGFMKFCGELI